MEQSDIHFIWRGYGLGQLDSMEGVPQGTANYGMRTMVERKHGPAYDDTALNSAEFFCCDIPSKCVPPKSY